MADGLILQFPAGVGELEYDAVNAKLNFNPRTGEGDWPDGLRSHSAGPSGSGWVVSEVWDSKDAQGAFMGSRLGPALADLPHPSVTWFDVVASQHRH